MQRAPLFATLGLLASALVSIGSPATAQSPTDDLAVGNTLVAKGLPYAALVRFANIVEVKSHPARHDAVVAIARLASALPDAANVGDPIEAEPLETFAPLHGDARAYGAALYAIGRARYRERHFAEALDAFGKIEPASPEWARAQMMAGAAHVQLRHAVPTVRSISRVLYALEEPGAQIPDAEKMRELAHLSIARVYYSTAITLDDNTNEPVVNGPRLSAAIRYWRKIPVTSEHWQEALIEQGWAYFIAGDYSRALGVIAAADSPELDGAPLPEAQILEAVIQFSTCHYDDAERTVLRFTHRYARLRSDLSAIVLRLKQDPPDGEVDAIVRSGPPAIARIASHALRTPSIEKTRALLSELDAETKTLAASPAAFRASREGAEASASLALGKTVATRDLAQLLRGAILRADEDLVERLHDAAKIRIDIMQAKLNQGSVGPQGVSAPQPPPRVESHTSWPMGGVTAIDPFGYADPIVSICGH